MHFWLGTHRPEWLAKVDVPLFVSRRRLAGRKKMPVAVGPWALDSGGFSELSLYGTWTIDAKQYAGEVRRFHDEIGGMVWAAPQDWMCEPWLVEKTGRSVEEHQRLTVENYLDLMTIDDTLPWTPVLQGWTLDEYKAHADMYETAGVRLDQLPLTAIGSVCRRQQTQGGQEVIEWFSSENGGHLPLHAFGMKTTGLRLISMLLHSSDSMAWSYAARKSPPLPGCTHKSCANCLRYALKWRERLLKMLDRRQFYQPKLLG